jgi:hypothetical protein
MAGFNKLERYFANALSRLPFLKRGAKFFYSRINALIYANDYTHEFKGNLWGFSLENKESFFGYYDKSPQNKSGDVLCHFSELPTAKKSNPEIPLDVAIFKYGNYSSPKYLLNTYAYNWQQGSRLQWLDDTLFIFNDFDHSDMQYVSRVHSIHKKDEVKRFDLPVQDAFKQEYFLSLNYQRLQALRPDYGYQNLPALNKQELTDLRNDGIWIVNFESADFNLLIALQDIVQFEPKTEFENALHYVNHVMISPNGEYFIFLHRYFIKGKRFDRLLLADRDGKIISVLADYDMVSHCCWADNETILGYLNDKNKNAGFYLINIHTQSWVNYADGKLDKQGDGHPHVMGDRFVCDTYPDKSRMQHLTLNNLESDESSKIGEFYHSFNYAEENRCDLHPRLASDGRSIFFDSVFDGSRKLYMIKLD